MRKDEGSVDNMRKKVRKKEHNKEQEGKINEKKK